MAVWSVNTTVSNNPRRPYHYSLQSTVSLHLLYLNRGFGGLSWAKEKQLITMVQVGYANEAEEHKVAKLLTLSYVISPILALTVVGALKAG
ncbi:hypothetical protein BKA65DRAFT_171103 [Rhexocercosporidium sp. MPI-PUGE-AT-0058]|nr:hypothetical protein BKA65DRAFT_171103 [Rhexocercosporidium sp. MPI-PUGE-AT-0058]